MNTLEIVGAVLGYIIGAGALHGYLKGRFTDNSHYNYDAETKFLGTVFWPITLLILGVFVPISNLTFRGFEKVAEKQVLKNEERIKRAKQLKNKLRVANRELKEAEEELEEELQTNNKYMKAGY